MNIKILCSITKVSRSGYYKWLIHSDDQDSDYADYLHILEIFNKGRLKYGFRTIKMKLQQKNIVMNHKKIIRIKKKYFLFTKIRRINPYRAIMKKTLEHGICENKLNRSFDQNVPYKVFCTDITNLFHNSKSAYLSVVKDIASGEIVAWNLARNLGVDVVVDTINILKNQITQSTLENSMIHSDQGFHYTSRQYIDMIKNLKMVQSMSRKGNCIDNAPIESFFGHLKDEIDYKSCKTHTELYSLIKEYMRYYNHKRQQWDLNKMTPVRYRNHLMECPVG